MAQLVIKRCSLQMLDEYPNAHNARTCARARTHTRAVCKIIYAMHQVNNRYGDEADYEFQPHWAVI